MSNKKSNYVNDKVIDGTGFRDSYDFQYDDAYITEEKFIAKIKNNGKRIEKPNIEELVEIGRSTRYRQNQKEYRFTKRTSVTRIYYLNPKTNEYYAEKEIVNFSTFPLTWYKL